MLLSGITRWSMRHSWLILVIWSLAVGFLGVFALRLPEVLGDHGLHPNGSYTRVQTILAAEFQIPEEPVLLHLERRPGFQEGFMQNEANQLVSKLQEDGMVKVSAVPLLQSSPLRNVQPLAPLLLSRQDSSISWVQWLTHVREFTAETRSFKVKLAGKPVVQEEVNRTSRTDLQRAEMVGIPIAVLILWLSFGGIVSSLLPVLIGGIGVVCSMGILYGIGTQADLSVFVLNVVPMVGLALSIDYALIIVHRYRHELARQPAERALPAAMASAGRSVLYSGICAALGLGVILLFPMPLFISVSIGALLVLTLSLLLTFTLLPALLWLLRGRIAAESSNITAEDRIRSRSGWIRLAGFVMKRPLRLLALTSALLFLLLLPAFRLQLAVPDETSLPQGSPARSAAEQLLRTPGFPGANTVWFLSEDRLSGGSPWWQRKTDRLLQQLKSDPQVLQAERYSLPGFRVLVSATLKADPSSEASRRWLRQQEQIRSADGFLLGGEPKYRQEAVDGLLKPIPLAIAVLLVSQYIVLFAAFRSYLIPLKTIGMNLISLGAAFGLLVWLFQDGRFGLEPTPIAVMIPVFIFGMTFAISMDFGVFLLSRIAEVYRRTGDNHYAVQEGLAATGRLITSAAAIMIAVTAPFAAAGVSGVKQLGLGITFAVFLDAVVVRMVLLPSLMKLLGSWNWIPRI